ncbi:Ribosomal protein S18 acetylase RimI [Amycolatopsis xylanica]|uniref:Ribosomal protein S18 acetylase RimI n=1 Tax=Amycolatopsis xylanica TaxID=589385 RepID=A0A1H3IPF9_9PSEU|nr:GNAT family N-acetyltransferase [Amycolatopsis xylanica]SDY29590.1 Ribosomal protein S18 acetylase RimI [Amycolatopsis xylanica]
MTISLRELTPDDWAEWRELRLEALREAPEAFGSTLADWLDAPESRWRGRLVDVPFNVLAEYEGKPAGIASGTAADESATVQLLSMWVAPFARGQGVADSLLDAVVAWARGLGAARVGLLVYETNERATALYRRHGFVEVSLAAGERVMSRALGS